MNKGVLAVMAFALIAIVGLFLFKPSVFQSIFASERQDISELMHQTIDPASPTFIHSAQVSCVDLGGEWFDQADKVGCFDIPPDLFDANNCIQPPYSAIQSVCNGVTGAQWLCNSQNVGCFY